MELTTKSKRRLILSLGLSVFFAVLTQLLFEITKPKNYSANGKKPIARLVTKSNSAEKKATKRLIWQEVDDGDTFISGEQIRTGSDSTVTFEILDTHTTLELEPNSLITIETDQGKPTLDFIQGNMFISSTDKGRALNVKSEGKVLDLSSDKVEVSKSASGAIDIDQLKENSPLGNELIASLPQPHDTLFTDKEGASKIEFRWQPMADNKLQVLLQMGSRRDNLKTISTASVDSKLMETNLLPGIYYWRLTAMDQSKSKAVSTTNVRTLKVLSRKPPLLISPAAQSEIIYSNEASAPVFKWTNPEHYRSFDIELAKDRDFKTSVIRKKIEAGTSLQIELSESGEYFWRVHAHLNPNDNVAVSPPQSFHIKQVKNISTPELKTPENNSKLNFQQSRSLQFSWKEAVGAETYKFHLINLAKKTKKSIETSKTIYVENDLEPGQYTWQVTAQADGAESKSSIDNKFEVLALSVIFWPYQNKIQPLFYFSATPEVRIEWKASQVPVASYQLKVSSKNLKNIEKNENNIDATQVSHDLKLQAPGVYELSVEGLDEHGDVVAKSAKHTFDIEPMPLLPAPVLLTESRSELMSDPAGSLKINWGCIPGAKSYQISIFKTPGSPPVNEITSSCVFEFHKQPPGQFAFNLAAIDGGNRMGRTSIMTTVKVPNFNQLPPPKVLKSKVE